MTFQKILIYLVTLVAFATAELATAQHTGKASFYGNKFHGRRTSDGSTYHKDSLTCAHKTLPFGTVLKVRNTTNGREVVVKVTDRGPYTRGRVVDLSMAAAKELKMVAQGVAKVEITNLGHISELGNTNFELAQYTHKFANGLPEPQFIDPATGRFYTMEQWKERGEEERKRHLAELAKKHEPRWRVLNDKLTAKNIIKPSPKDKK